MKHTSRFYHLLAIFSIIVWGTTFVSTKLLLLNGLTPPEIFLYRFAQAYLCIWFWSPRRLWADSWKDEALLLLAGISGGSLYFYAENTALGITLASNVSLIIATTPILTALLACAVYRQERLRANLVAGSFVALVGVALVVFNGSFILEINPLGDLLTLFAAGLWAVYSLVLKRLENGYPVLFITRK
ncbi:MAG: DMT family transporter, partial [Coprobacter sp.]|nr:DMT family transporter [Coprobacter sp.]